MIETNKNRSKSQDIGFFLGIFIFLGILLIADLDPSKPIITKMAAVASIMAIWWITEAIPISATALLPIVMYPILGIMSGKEIAPTYMSTTLFLFIGGFMIALAMEKWNLHRRIALNIISIFGGSPNLIILGFMVATAFLSMWISNTATAVMMVPIGLAIIYKLEAEFGEEKSKNFSIALMLSIAYSASIGGIATIVGTPPNLSFARIFEVTFPNAPPISFGQWMILGVPISIAHLLISWFVLTRIIFKFDKNIAIDAEIIKQEKNSLAKISSEEISVLIVFILTAVLWIFRTDLNIGFLSVPGWSRLLENPKYIDDGVVAMFMALTLFLIPAKKDNEKTKIIDAEIFKKIPWAIIILFGGGFALAKGFKVSGLSQYIGEQFAGMEGVSPILVIGIISFSITFLTELTSNMATTEMVLPILSSVAVAMKTNPLLLMIPATISASCAFMMPVATAPNAIVFGSNRLKIMDMVKAGILLNLLGVAVITVAIYFILPIAFDTEIGEFPEWAQETSKKH